MVHVTVGRSWDLFRIAASVTQETFHEKGYARRTPSGVRMIPQYLNPGTVSVVAEWDGQPAAALILIPDGPFGLPSDRAFVEEIDQLRDSGRHPLIEIGSLGVLEEFRRHTRELANHALTAAFMVMRDSGPDAFEVAAVEPKQVRFYENLFGMSALSPDVRPLFGAPAAICGTSARGNAEAIFAERAGAQRRKVRSLVDHAPTWLTDRRSSDDPRWPREEVRLMLAENGVLERLDRQAALVKAPN